MNLTHAVARPMLAGIFIAGGIDAIRNPEGKAKRAEDVALPLADQLHLPTDDPVTLVRLNGGVQVAAGALLAVGKAPRLASLALMGSLVPTTYAGHRWWEEDDAQARNQQRVQFLKNLAILGGLVLAATERQRRRRMADSARRMGDLGKSTIKAAERAARDAATSQAVQSTATAAREAAGWARDRARETLPIAG